MSRTVLIACLPWLALLIGSVVLLTLLVRFNQTKPNFRRLLQLHRDEVGSAQSLSFVLTLPFFVMIILFIVQVSQLMIGTVVVNYAAFAAARSASVWLPANTVFMPLPEPANCISYIMLDPNTIDQVEPTPFGPSDGGLTYVVNPIGSKFNKIASAAALACVPICPSRNLNLTSGDYGLANDLIDVYTAVTVGAEDNAAIPRRIRNKLLYSLLQTSIEVKFFHSNQEPPLEWSPLATDVPYDEYFARNELGWQDPITVTVTHNLALLPGPGRLLARPAVPPSGASDEVSQRISRLNNEIYVYPLTASITMSPEGEKSVVPYVHY